MAQLDDIYTTSVYLIPWVTFLLALGGSVHCIGMCGGLSLAFNKTPKANIFYQVGRLAGYLVLTMLAITIGDKIQSYLQTDHLILLASLAMGLTLIAIGIKTIYPQFLTKVLISNKFSKWIINKGLKLKSSNQYFNSLLMGSLSIFLPCGFLYSVILVIAVFGNPLLGAISIFTFWLGTTPALVFTPQILQRFILPIKKRAPVLSSSFLIFIGLLTISTRFYQFYTTGSCH